MIFALAALAVAGCGPQTPTSAETPKPGENGLPATPEATACAGTVMPISGACVVAASSGDLLDPKCVWKPEEVKRSDTEVLVMDVQDCKGYSFTYAFTNPGELHTIQANATAGDPPYDNIAARVFDIPAGKTAQDVALAKLSEAPEAERARCIAKPDAAPNTFQLAPDDAFMAELRKDQDGQISACGPFGFTDDSVVWWEAHGTKAIFHATGQDTPSWNPKSFVFYTRDASGAWVKEAAAH
jgi:hypothetical protein